MMNFKVLEWLDRPLKTRKVNVTCEGCEADGDMEVDFNCIPLASKGMGIFFDSNPKKNTMPDKVQCRKCGRVYVR